MMASLPRQLLVCLFLLLSTILLTNALPAFKQSAYAAKDATSAPTTPPGAATTAKSTTLDAIVEFCQEACQIGVGGPECNCPNHPVGWGHSPIGRRRGQKGI